MNIDFSYFGSVRQYITQIVHYQKIYKFSYLMLSSS